VVHGHLPWMKSVQLVMVSVIGSVGFAQPSMAQSDSGVRPKPGGYVFLSQFSPSGGSGTSFGSSLGLGIGYPIATTAKGIWSVEYYSHGMSARNQSVTGNVRLNTFGAYYETELGVPGKVPAKDPIRYGIGLNFYSASASTNVGSESEQSTGLGLYARKSISSNGFIRLKLQTSQLNAAKGLFLDFGVKF
jgi:hypothetical protein